MTNSKMNKALKIGLVSLLGLAGLASCGKLEISGNAFYQKGKFRGYVAEAGVFPDNGPKCVNISQDGHLPPIGVFGISAHDYNMNGRFDMAVSKGHMDEIGVSLQSGMPVISQLNLYANPDSLEVAYNELKTQWEENREQRRGK